MSKNIEDEYKCYCEKKLCGCKPKEKCCCVNMNEWFEGFEMYSNGQTTNDICCCIICCPIKFPILLLFLPYTLYNICRNNCNGTNNKNYLC